jgi:RNA polymerase sigma-70 factor (ECF subfamily)
MITKEQSLQVAEWADEWHEDLVRFLARRTGAVADASDLAQEVYVRLLRLDRLDFIRQPRSYLFRIAANLLHEWRLKAAQSQPHREDWLETLIAHDDPQADTASELRNRRLTAELARLPPSIRVALLMQLNEGLSYEEIAVKMNASPRMVKRYLLTAFAALRARLPKDL